MHAHFKTNNTSHPHCCTPPFEVHQFCELDPQSGYYTQQIRTHSHFVLCMHITKFWLCLCADEAASGYFNRPWKWETIRANAQRIVQVGSEDGKKEPFSTSHLLSHADGEYNWLTHITDATFSQSQKKVTKGGKFGALLASGAHGSGDTSNLWVREARVRFPPVTIRKTDRCSS